MRRITGGYNRVHRKWIDNPVLSPERCPYCPAAAWLWTISQARFADEKVGTEGKVLVIGRGQLSVSLRSLAAEWNWSLARVQRELAKWAREGMIEASSDTGQTVITLCNYSQYNDTQADSGTPAIHQRYTTTPKTDTGGAEGNGCVPGTSDEHRQPSDTPAIHVPAKSDTESYKKERIKEEGRKDSCPPDGGSGPAMPAQQADLIPAAKIIPMPLSDADAAFLLWNETAARCDLPSVRPPVSKVRKAKMNARLKEVGGLPGWREALAMVEAAPFLRGDNDRGWRADIDFMLEPSKLARVREGVYTRLSSKNQAQPSAADAARELQEEWGLLRERG